MEGHIVTATRGGQGSRAVQKEAIRRARSLGLPLVFLYVIDLSTMGDLDERMRAAVRNELTWLGKALLKAAQIRARTESVEADIVVLEGRLQDEIARYLHETDASMLLLGATRSTTGTFFGADAIQQFASTVQQETGVPVHVIRPELLSLNARYEMLPDKDEQTDQLTEGDGAESVV